jgi:hypothetical protein
MLIWGGGSFWDFQPTGASYDPTLDTWTPTSTVGEPAHRYYHAGVWTGDRMLVWGGVENAVEFNDGGIYDPEGTDGDGDDVGCALDCDDSDGGVFAAPSDVRDLTFTGPTELRWVSSAALTGSSTTYDLVRGATPELPVGAGTSETCVAGGWTSPDDGFIRYEDPFEPAPGQAVFYVLRASNPSGVGGYGFASDGTPRVTGACP